MPVACDFIRLLPVLALLASVAAAQALKPEELSVHSSILGEDRRILVRLPRHYQRDAASRYPVLYKFDGDNGLQRYDETIDVLASIDATPDLIVVAIPNGRGMRNRDLTPPALRQNEAPDGRMGTGELGRGDRFLDFIERELIPYVDARYRTAPPRLLAGHSRGALLVIHSLAARPDLFQARFVFSAPMMRDEQRLIADTRAFFRAHPKHASFLYCNWGEQENEGMQQSYAAMRALLTKEAPKGLKWTIERARAADHQSTPLTALPSAIRHFFSGGSALGLAANLDRVSGGPKSSIR